MRRIIEFHTWQAQTWKARADEVEIPSGARAYALRQKHSREELAATCTTAWRNVGVYMNMGEGVVTAGQPLVEAGSSRVDTLTEVTQGISHSV